jgi:hypothetical protein
LVVEEEAMTDRLDPDTELKMKELLWQVVDNRLFPQIRKEIEDQIAAEMLVASKGEDREGLHREYLLANRFFDRLTSIANEVRVWQGQKAKG